MLAARCWSDKEILIFDSVLYIVINANFHFKQWLVSNIWLEGECNLNVIISHLNSLIYCLSGQTFDMDLKRGK